MATFLDGEPIRGRDGQIIAPVVQAPDHRPGRHEPGSR